MFKYNGYKKGVYILQLQSVTKCIQLDATCTLTADYKNRE